MDEALRKLIRATGKNEPVEIVCLVGKPLATMVTGDDERRERSKRINGRTRNVRVMCYYDELIEEAYRTYNSFLDTSPRSMVGFIGLSKTLKLKHQR